MKKIPTPKDKIIPKITREEAIKRLGLSAFSAATMMFLLNEPAKGEDSPDSPDNPPDWP